MKTKLTFRISLMLLMFVAAISSAWAQDTEPPKIDNKTIVVTAITQNSISISWIRATDPGGTSQGLLEYTVKCEGTPSKTLGPFTDMSSYTITGLNPDTEYKIWVEVMDKAGNSSSYFPIYRYTLSAPTVAATGVSISPTGPISLTVGATTTLTATVAPSDATNKTVTWSSSSAGVAEVSTSGVVTAKSVGSTTITARTHNGKTATVTVNVTAGVDTERPTVPKNVTVSNLSATGLKVTWDASTDNVTIAGNMKYYVEISRSKQVQASTTVTGATIHTFSGLTLVPAYEYTIAVKAIDEAGNESTWGVEPFTVPGTVSITGLSLDKTSVNLAVGATESITANVTPIEATNRFGCTWTISDPTVVSMVFNPKSLEQNITGLKTGTATLTVTSPDGSLTATCAITVGTPTVPVTSVSLNKSSTTLAVGASETLAATVAPATATNKAVKWETNSRQ